MKLPARLAQFLRRLVPALLACGLALALVLARAQHDPGDGVWHDEAERFVGRLVAKPYPMLRIATGRPEKPVETVLLVSEGKRGGGERVAALDGRMAAVRGTILERDGVRLLELAERDGVAAVDSATAALDATGVRDARGSEMGTAALQGEIIDPKCYSGAMKPGEGKTHKECATLCIAGGIPPMFVTLDAAGRKRYYLLTDAAGGPLDERILPFVADLVEIRGVVEQRDDVALFKIEPADIRRL